MTQCGRKMTAIAYAKISITLAQMSCSTCTTGGGCSTEKGPQRAYLAASFAELYPDRTWGHLHAEAAWGKGITEREARAFSQSLSVVAHGPVRFVTGRGDTLCHTAYVLCVGRPPSLLDIREGRAPAESDAISEQYLRIHFSTVMRAFCVQEVAMELGQGLVREIPRPGVYDPKLLKRFQKIVDFLEASGLEHLDFGLLDAPYPDVVSGEYSSIFATTPTLLNFFFYAAPALMQVTTPIVLAQGA